MFLHKSWLRVSHYRNCGFSSDQTNVLPKDPIASTGECLESLAVHDAVEVSTGDKLVSDVEFRGLRLLSMHKWNISAFKDDGVVSIGRQIRYKCHPFFVRNHEGSVNSSSVFCPTRIPSQ
jgi:hypothetical protein